MNERDLLIQELIKEKGGTKEQYLQLLDSIAYHESAGTLDPTTKQKGGGPGRGKYQFETGKNAGGITAAKRAKAYYKQLGKTLPKWLDNIKGDDLDVSSLSSEQQDILFLANIRKHPKADFSKVWKGEESIEDFWANYHWAGNKRDRADRLQDFKNSMATQKDSLQLYNDAARDFSKLRKEESVFGKINPNYNYSIFLKEAQKYNKEGKIYHHNPPFKLPTKEMLVDKGNYYDVKTDKEGYPNTLDKVTAESIINNNPIKPVLIQDSYNNWNGELDGHGVGVFVPPKEKIKPRQNTPVASNIPSLNLLQPTRNTPELSHRVEKVSPISKISSTKWVNPHFGGRMIYSPSVKIDEAIRMVDEQKLESKAKRSKDNKLKLDITREDGSSNTINYQKGGFINSTQENNKVSKDSIVDSDTMSVEEFNKRLEKYIADGGKPTVTTTYDENGVPTTTTQFRVSDIIASERRTKLKKIRPVDSTNPKGKEINVNTSLEPLVKKNMTISPSPKYYEFSKTNESGNITKTKHYPEHMTVQDAENIGKYRDEFNQAAQRRGMSASAKITPINIKAHGGNLPSNEINNNLNSYNEGGLHHQNPYGGIPQGIGMNGKMNTVEEGETSFKIGKNKYIFSNRIKI